MASLLSNSTSGSATTSDVLRNTFLSLAIVVGCGGNLYLLIVVCASRTMRRRSVYKLILNAVVANLIDILINLSIVLGSSLMSKWTYGTTVCQVNAFFINWLDDVHLLNLLLLAIERSVAVHVPRLHRKRFREGTCAVLIALTWLITFAINVPIASRTIEPFAVQSRYSCALKTKITIIYTSITLFACFLLPFCSIVALYIDIVRVAASRENEKDGWHNGGQVSTVWRELNMSKLTASTTGAWIVLVGPYTVMVYIDCIKYSKEFSNVLNPSGASADDSLLMDTVFFWMRNYFNICLPFLCVIFRRDVRRKTRHLACNTEAHRAPRSGDSPPSNHHPTLHSIGSPRRNDTRGTPTGHRNENATNGYKGSRMEEDDEIDSVNSDDDEDITPEDLRLPPPPNVPVLFATSEGLHVQTDTSVYDSRGMDSVITARVIKCDVTNSSADLRSRDDDPAGQHDGEDDRTSDYASNRDSDAYQLSNPISVRSAGSNLSNGRRQSGSSQQPAVPPPRRLPRRHESVPGEIGQEGEVNNVTTTERCIDPPVSGNVRPPSGEKKRRKKGRVERTDRHEVGADLEAARAPVNALYNGVNGDNQNAQETKEKKPKRRRHKRTGSDVAPAPEYSTQISKESTVTPPSLTGSVGSAQASEFRRARRRDRSRGEDELPSEKGTLPKPPRRLEPLDGGLAQGIEKEDVGMEALPPEEKPRKRRRKKKSSTDPAPIEMSSWNPT